MRGVLVSILVSVAVAAAVAGCGSSPHTKTTSSTSSTSASPSTPSPPARHNGKVTARCRALSVAVVQAASSATPQQVESLAASPAGPLICSALFVDGSGGLIVELTEAPGSRQALAAARSGARGDVGSVHPLPGFASGYFATRELGFLRHGRLVRLSAGYSGSGQIQVSPTQLVRLARVVARSL